MAPVEQGFRGGACGAHAQLAPARICHDQNSNWVKHYFSWDCSKVRSLCRSGSMPTGQSVAELESRGSQLDLLEAKQRLGVTLRTLGWQLRGTERKDEAVRALTEAVELLRHVAGSGNRSTSPARWSHVQWDLGLALYQLAVQGKPGLLKEWAEAYEASLLERPLEWVPRLQAETGSAGLAVVHWELGKPDRNRAHLMRALECFRAAPARIPGRRQRSGRSSALRTGLRRWSSCSLALAPRRRSVAPDPVRADSRRAVRWSAVATMRMTCA